MFYYQLSVLAALAALPLTCISTPLASRWDNMRLKHNWDAVPEKWESMGPPPAGAMIDLRIALRPQYENALIDTLYEVSSPKHPRYGMYLSREQVAKLVAPHPDTLGLVRSWLEHYGVPSSSLSITHSGNWLKVISVPVPQANSLLGASYQLYRHTETNDTIIRTIGYALPEVLQAHLKTVAPTTYFGSPRTLSKVLRMIPGDAAAATAEEPAKIMRSNQLEDIYITPSFLRWLYRSESYVTKATDRNSLGVTGYHGQYPRPADLRKFMKEYRTSGTDADYDLQITNSDWFGPRPPGEEASLDIQYTQGMAYPTPHIFYGVSGSPPFTPDSSTPVIPDSDTLINTNEPFLDWLDYVLSKPIIPPTISSSYSDNEQTVPEDYAKSVCDSFAELGTRGVSFLASSGYFGVGEGDCVVNDGSGKVQFLPTFPSSCPFVTSVGGTQGFPEVAASRSSGGFSNYFAVPDYQRTAVSTYIRNLGGLHDGLFNTSSRGFPDIAAHARNFVIIFKGNFLIAEGTSCSAPVVAGIISLLNDFLLSQGEKTLGFLNPLLYGELQWGLNDITYGLNPGCKTGGFPAAVGWDPVTGLGTPDFLELQKILIAIRPYRMSNPMIPV